MSEVRGKSWEDPMCEGQWPRGVTPHLRSESARLQWCRNSLEEPRRVRGQGRWLRGATPRPTPGATAERSHPASNARVSGQEEPPSARSQGWRPGGATPCPRSRGCMGTGGPKGANPTLKFRKGDGEEIPLIQGKEQQLHFAGAALERYPTPKVRETQVRR